MIDLSMFIKALHTHGFKPLRSFKPQGDLAAVMCRGTGAQCVTIQLWSDGKHRVMPTHLYSRYIQFETLSGMALAIDAATGVLIGQRFAERGELGLRTH